MLHFALLSGSVKSINSIHFAS